MRLFEIKRIRRTTRVTFQRPQKKLPAPISMDLFIQILQRYSRYRCCFKHKVELTSLFFLRCTQNNNTKCPQRQTLLSLAQAKLH